MNKEERNQAIEKVRELYKAYRLIELLERDIKTYEESLAYVIKEQRELSNLKIDAEEGFNTSFEEKYNYTHDITGKTEKQIEKYISDLRQQEINCRREITDRKKKITEKNIEYEGLKWNIEQLDPYYKSIIECVCRDKHPISYLINTKFLGNKSTAYDHLDKALNSIMEFENWRG